jgi:RsiW-degrading membrane proteinase PrsW (M82 family)
MKLSIGQKKELKGMIVSLILNIVLWLLASTLLHFPWNHTLVLSVISVTIAIIYSAVIVFRHRNDE